MRFFSHINILVFFSKVLCKKQNLNSNNLSCSLKYYFLRRTGLYRTLSITMKFILDEIYISALEISLVLQEQNKIPIKLDLIVNIIVKKPRHSYCYVCVFCLDLENNILRFIKYLLRSCSTSSLDSMDVIINHETKNINNIGIIHFSTNCI